MLCFDTKLLIMLLCYLHKRFDETATVPGILVEVEPVKTGQGNEGHLRDHTMLQNVCLCFLLTWDTELIWLLSRESHSS